jgi:iron complex outermembrane recepter protein
MSGIPSSGLGRARPVLLSALLASSALTSATSAFAADSNAIETVVVTAQKRSEDIQKVPLSIQVFSTKRLEQLHVQSFEDYALYLPSVSFAANAAGGGLSGPGSMNVYMRGVASGNDGNHSGSTPSVGVYLDEQPVTAVGGAVDLHLYDIERVEALAGPQGTLYGANSEAGTLRIITNKPDASGFSAAYQVEGNTVDHGGVGGVLEGYVNVPLADNIAIRLVGWEEHDAGYIDNVAGTDPNAGIVDGVRTFPSSGIQISNAPFRKNNYNDADIYGGRGALKIDLDNNWTITPSFVMQETKSNGSFAFDPTVGDLKVVKFAPEFSHDSWYQAALTVQGKVGNLDLTYAGAYLDRRESSQLDYSDYSYFYDSSYGHYFTNNAGNLINPSQLIKGKDHFTTNSHELRIASPTDDRFRFVGGLFFERQTHDISQDYEVAGLADALTIPGSPNALWLTDQIRTDTDYAAFGEASFDITPQFTITTGGRVFEADNSLEGFFGFSKGWDDLTGSKTGMASCFEGVLVKGSPCTDLDKHTSAKGFTHKLNATWHVTDDVMLYATWSNGFRPGGVNRNAVVTDAPYRPEYLMNYEAGWKTSFADDTVHFNGALFLENWDNFQFSFLGPNSLTVIANAGQARIKGFETSLDWNASDALTLSGAATYTDAYLTEPYCKDPLNCSPPGAPAGQMLPITPKFKASATARYAFKVADWDAHVQGSLQYQTKAWADLRSQERGDIGAMPEYTIVNFSTGVDRDNWSLELALDNAFDERAETYRYSECTQTVCGPETYVIPVRPRTISLRFSQKF